MPARRLLPELPESQVPGLLRVGAEVLGWLEIHEDTNDELEPNHILADYARAWSRALWRENFFDRASRFERWARDLERIQSKRCVKAARSLLRAQDRLLEQIHVAAMN